MDNTTYLIGQSVYTSELLCITPTQNTSSTRGIQKQIDPNIQWSRTVQKKNTLQLLMLEQLLYDALYLILKQTQWGKHAHGQIKIIFVSICVSSKIFQIILHYPKPQYVEIDPEELWNSVINTIKEAIAGTLA